MGSSQHTDASTKEFEDDLVDTGTKILNVPSSTEELIALLERAECLLSKVRQHPPGSMAQALLPIMKAFKVDEIFHHENSNVQVSIMFCLSELTRITAPEPPYNYDKMKEIFQLFVTVLKKMSCQSDSSYHKVVKVLETMANVKSCILLLDIDSGALTVEMIQLFLDNIRSGHHSHVLENMEAIMTMLILEADEIPVEITRQLLAAVKLENKNVSPVSWELGEKVIRSCSVKLERSMREAVISLKLDLKDYAEVVASVCQDKSSRKKKVEGMTGQSSDGISRSGELPKELSPPEPEDSREIKNETKQEGNSTGAVKRKRGRKPNSLMTPDEGYDHTWIRGGKDAFEITADGKKKASRSSRRGRPKKIETMGIEETEEEFPSMSRMKDSSDVSRKGKSTHGLDDIADKGGNTELGGNKKKDASEATVDGKSCEKKSNHASRRRGRPRKTERMSNEGTEEDLPSMSRMEDSSDVTRKGKSTHGVKEEGIHEDTDLEHKSEEGSKVKKLQSLSMSKPANSKQRGSPSVMGKSLRKSHVKSSYGEELVGSGIKVWWPLDKIFYEGTVMSFDSETKKHQIKYYDDEEEILNLSKEKWELLDGEHSEQKNEEEVPSPATSLGKAKTKEIKRKGSSSRKQECSALPSKRKRTQWSVKYGESLELDAKIEDDVGAEPDEVAVSSDEDREKTLDEDSDEPLEEDSEKTLSE